MTADCTSSRAVQNHHRQEDTLGRAQCQRCAQLGQAASTLQPQRLAVHVDQQGWHRARGEARIHQGQLAEEVVHGRTGQEVAEEEGGEDMLPGGANQRSPAGGSASLCCGCPKAGNSRKAGKDNTHRAMHPLQAKENPDHGSGEGERMAAHTRLGVHQSSFTDLNP